MQTSSTHTMITVIMIKMAIDFHILSLLEIVIAQQ
jgi:hypothetical protein